MKNLRFFAYTSSFLSLVISLAMIGLWISGVWELKVVNLNTFIGVTVSLLAIIVTLAIAWQIYNAVDMKNKVEELKQLEDRIKKQEKSLDQVTYRFKHHICHMMSNTSIQRSGNETAFYYLILALENTMQLKKPINVEIVLSEIEFAVQGIDDIHLNKEFIDEIIKSDQTIRSLPNYVFIKNRYEPVYNEFISKVEKHEEKV